MNKIQRNFGFGCMRLPMKDGAVDYAEFSRMIDIFLDAGYNYFDTAHGYLDGKSETAIRDCLVARYDRERYVLTNKLSIWYVKDASEVRPYFENQLVACGVDYFDFYLCHALDRESYEDYKRCRAFETVSELKEEGKVRHIGISFHDTADVLDRILTEQPSIEVVQLQINYLDADDPAVQSVACYETAVRHGKRVIVMEPVKGGALVGLPDGAKAIFDALGGGSYASYALRYAASFPEVFMVLSGMGSVAMVEDNVKSMYPFRPLDERERDACDRARAVIREAKQIPCTACNYCAELCPKGITISAHFRAANEVSMAHLTRSEARATLPAGGGPADCIGCGACESVCPQHIHIREQLANVKKTLRL